MRCTNEKDSQGQSCTDQQNCCANGKCCDEVCNECESFGLLAGGTVTAGSNTVCVGDTITFTPSGVENRFTPSERVNCVVVGIGHVPPTYTWVITKPDTTTVSGSGPVATVVADLGGTYSVTFTVTAERKCPPTPRLLLASAEATQPDLALAGVADEDEETLGGFLCVNDDDDNGNGTPDKVVKRLAVAGLKPERHENRVYFPDPDGLTVQLSAENDWNDWQ